MQLSKWCGARLAITRRANPYCSIGPRKLLRAVLARQGSLVPRHATTTRSSKIQQDLHVPSITKRAHGSEAEASSFSWSIGAHEMDPHDRTFPATDGVSTTITSFNIDPIGANDVAAPTPSVSLSTLTTPEIQDARDDEGSGKALPPRSMVLLVEDNPINMQVWSLLPCEQRFGNLHRSNLL